MKIKPYDGFTLSENQLRVLQAMYRMLDGEYGERALYFRSLAKETGLSEPVVRVSCRALARKGCMEFVRGLFDDDGMVAGSGYGLTAKGVEVIERMEEYDRVKKEAKTL